jgi:glutaredoxin
MKAHVYGFGDTCGKCVAAKEKLKLFGFEVVEHKYEYHVKEHEGWKNDGSVDVTTAANLYGEHAVPLLRLDDETEVLDYPGMMKHIRERRAASTITSVPLVENPDRVEVGTAG